MIFLAPSLALAILIGFLLTAVLWPEPRGSRASCIFQVCLSTGLGLGLVSVSLFLFLLEARVSRVYFVIETISCILLGLIYHRKVNRPRESAKYASPSMKSTAIPVPAMMLFVATLILALVNDLALCLQFPHGCGMDSWAIWNVRASFLYRMAGSWHEISEISSHFVHPDYPLLVPAVVARLWHSIGHDAVIVPIVVANLFAFALVGMLICTLLQVTTSTNALLAGITLLGTQTFLVGTASQASDVPVSFFFLATMCLFFQHDLVWKGDCRLLLLAGICTGLGLWTKNEGWLLGFSVLLARFVITPFLIARVFSLKELSFFLSGLAPIIAVALYYKIWLVPPSEFFVVDRFNSILLLLEDWSRYFIIAKAFAKTAFYSRQWGWITLALLIYPCLVGVTLTKDLRLPVVFTGATLGLLFIGYFLIYVITPYNLQWHICTSLDRLLLQLWPSLLLVYFSIMGTPGPQSN